MNKATVAPLLILAALTALGPACFRVDENFELVMYVSGGLSTFSGREYLITVEGDSAHWSIEEEALDGEITRQEGDKPVAELRELYTEIRTLGFEELENAGELMVTDQHTYTVTATDGVYTYGFKVYGPSFQPDERYLKIIDAITGFCQPNAEGEDDAAPPETNPADS